jgi:hypothetical protein
MLAVHPDDRSLFSGGPIGFGGFVLLDGAWWNPPSGYLPYGYAPDPFDFFDEGGRLRLKIQPKEAQVFVDWYYYAGIVDDFNGRFQHLDLRPGPHHIEVRAHGYENLEFDITIEPHRTVEYRGALVKSP